MSINKLKFMTPITEGVNYKLEKNYSHTLVLNENEEINISSNVGPRDNQEDVVSVQSKCGYTLLLVADGMGGEINGEQASFTLAKKIHRWFGSLSQKTLTEINEVNIKKHLARVINDMKEEYFPRHGGTTLNMSLIGPEETIIVNIGDSRTYSILGDEIILRTQDDSLSFKNFKPQSKEERDMLRYYVMNNVITNCVEMRSVAKINITLIHNDDYDILCHITDGVSDILSEDKIYEYCLAPNPAETLVEKAVTSELEFNGPPHKEFYEFIYPHDNASAVVYTKKRVKNN